MYIVKNALRSIARSKGRNILIGIFRELADQGKCVILVSHSPQVAAMCDERYELVKLGRTK